MKAKLLRIGLWMAAALAVLAVAVAAAWETGLLERWARAELIQQVEKATGGRVDLGGFHLRLSPLAVELDGFTLHGREAADEPPFVHIDKVTVGIDARALLARRVILGEVDVQKPAVYVRIDREGHSNLPTPARRGPSKPWHEQLFSITIDHLRLEDGVLRFNDRRIPLSAGGGRFSFLMDYFGGGAGRDFYQGQIGWQDMEVAGQDWLPFPSTWSARFTIGRRGGALDEFQWQLPHSSVEGRVQWPDWTQKSFEAHYRARLDLGDIRTLLRKPHTPVGSIESTGDLRYAPGDWSLKGYYSARGIGMAYKWFHERGMSSRGTILANGQEVVIPDFEAWVMGGEVAGKVRMDARTEAFTATTRSHDVRLGQLLAAVQNSDFPVQTLHWEAGVTIDSVTQWRADFRDMTSRGDVKWAPLEATPAGKIPARAAIQYDYRMAGETVYSQGTIETPHTQVNLRGTINDRDSNMATDLKVSDLRDWDDLINVLRGSDAPPASVSGQAAWQGTLTGPISHPLFSGQAQARDPGYDRVHWDSLAGGVSYSPNGLTLTDMKVRRGRLDATLSLHMDLTNWAFLPESEWNYRVQFVHADSTDLQELAGTHYPVHAWLSGQFQGGGTRSHPELSGPFQLDDFAWKGFTFSRISGRLELDPSLVRVAEVAAVFGPGRLSGELSYQRPSGNVEFDVAGRSLPLDAIRPIQTPALPLAGRLDFHFRGSGAARAPQGQGTVRISSLRAGNDMIGDLAGRVTADGKRLDLGLSASLVKGKLSGALALTMADGYPLEGRLTAQGIDLDPFIQAGLHLRAITGHSSIDGQFQFSGELLHPETIAIDSNVSHIEFAYENVKLENVGPVRLVYRKSDVRVQQADLRGADSNFQLSGEVRFHRDQPLDLRVAGALNLKLAQGFVPGLLSQGSAQVDALIEGTFGQPRISGRAHLGNASLVYSDLPIGLSAVNGDLVFSSDRVSFANVQAEAGGGKLTLGGSASFPSGLRRTQYDISIDARDVRVRWPTGMSWLVSAKARMAGNTQAATLGGQITLNRLLLTNGPDSLAVLLMAAKQPGVPSEGASPFERNLQLDFAVNSGAGSLMEWTGARIETDASVRVRGTWSRPSVLGHVHLLSGRIDYAGNTYQLTRGDMNFANPLVLDPVMNLEATTTIQQYEITVDLTGPASAPQFSYRSDPPLPETDVISLLALGTTGEASELRTTGNAGQYGATALLSQAVSSEVGGRIARLFGISRFSVEPFATGTGLQPNEAARITIEQQVTPNLSVTYATNAASNSQQVIQIEYAVSRDISIVGLRDINGTFGLDVEFKKHFK